jgi:hypothetical protein
VRVWHRQLADFSRERLYPPRLGVAAIAVWVYWDALCTCMELPSRGPWGWLTAAGYSPEWADVLRDLESLQSVEVEYQGKRFRLRSEARGTCSQVFQAVGVAFPPTMEAVID